MSFIRTEYQVLKKKKKKKDGVSTKYDGVILFISLTDLSVDHDYA